MKIIATIPFFLFLFSFTEAFAANPLTCIDPAAQTGQACTCNPTADPINLATTAQVLSCCQGTAHGGNGVGLPGLFYWAVDCTQGLVAAASTSYVTGITNALSGAVIMVLTIALATFGYKLGTNAMGRKTKGEAIGLMVKIVAIIGILFAANGSIFSINSLIATVISFGNNMGAVVASAVLGAGNNNNIWMIADRVLSAFLGEAGSLSGLATIGGAMLLYLAALFFTGPLGSVISAMVIGTIFTIIFAMVSVVYLQFTSVIALTFLGGLAPIFLPCMLFKEKGLRGMFDKWLKLIITYSLQPVVLMAYLGLMLSVFSIVIGFTPSNFAAAPPALNVQPTILGYIQNAVTSCTWFTIIFYPINGPCLDPLVFTTTNIINFGMLVLETLILAISMIAFLREFPRLMKTIAGDQFAPDVGAGEGGMESFQEMGDYATDKVQGGADGIVGGARNTAGSVMRAPFRMFGGDEDE